MDEEFLIDPERITARAQSFKGTFLPRDLERLEDSLADERGELRYDITAALDGQRRRVLSCIIEGFVFLMCQKTLEVFRHEISIRERLVLVDDEARLPAIEEEGEVEDYVVAESPLDIRDLVEDAVLLALPMVPRKPEWETGPREVDAGAGNPAREPQGKGPVGKESPFAALASLRKK